ncbi:GAF domain-containing protein [filamentous cyanobacterium LEGE 11480]|uniref:histidine kinase n=2 Tax=Romeriopsis TaxID=2992131 RepID=A0A928VMI2_9CYAN|nr:GAF domain-containing protein [Romeriopsis navalis LEGE 11480]
MVIAKSVRQQAILATYRETFPIRTPGAIQPHGVLVAIDPATLTITQVSQNIQLVLGYAPFALLGKPLKILLSKTQLLQLTACLDTDFEHVNPLKLQFQLQGKMQYFDGIVHQTDAAIILELEPTASAATVEFISFHRLVKGSLNRMQQVAGLQNFLTLVSAEIRKLTGFDRVMVYRFDHDHAGIVEAESKTDALSPYLGLHFPAIDIPPAARELFQDSPLRLIPNIDYAPVPLIGHDDEQPPLDMSRSLLRQASPCHLEYLRNMGVASTMIIPLIKDQQLWGLIACHHQTPKMVSYEIRSACEFLGQVMCLELSSKVNQTQLNYQVKLQQLQATLIETIVQSDDLTSALVKPDDRLLSLVGAQGAAVCLDQEVTLLGTTPNPAEIRELLLWLTVQAESNLFYTDTLAEQYAPAAAYQSIASGVLFLQISQVRHYAILWFRPEVIQTVQWAGEPQAAMVTDATGAMALSPRKSFEIWQETVHHASLPWKTEEIASALELRSSLVGIVLNRADELAELNTELTRSNQELDSFAYAASHDLQEPLRGIHNYATFVLQDYEDAIDDAGIERLQTIVRLTQRMDSLINALLRFSRLGQAALECKPVDLDRILDRVIRLMQVNRCDMNFEVRRPAALATAQCAPVLVEELFSNLISNALKYNDQATKWVEIGIQPPCVIEEQPAATIYYVRDNGIGIRERHQNKIFQLFKRLHGQKKYGGGTGAGLTIAKKIVERHGGKLWLESTYGQGSTFYFTLGQ